VAPKSFGQSAGQVLTSEHVYALRSEFQELANKEAELTKQHVELENNVAALKSMIHQLDAALEASRGINT
jgi:predicted  nucleic acid-binding Zn-ribbon protein